MSEIMARALESGLWAALFCFLFLYMLKDSKLRENKYTAALEALTSQLGTAIAALKVCDEIKSECDNSVVAQNEIKRDTEQIKSEVEQLREAMEGI